jgi:hypothetical protein
MYPVFGDDTAATIKKIITEWCTGYPIESLEGFLSFVLTLNSPLYSGDLSCDEYSSHMINMAYELGFNINRVRMSDVMDSAPFKTKYNNALNSREVTVLYKYVKQDRATGKMKDAKHTIRIKPSGYVTHSGPDFQRIRQVYYLFMKKVLENYETIQSSMPSAVRKVKYIPKRLEISQEEFQSILSTENSLRENILNDHFIEAMSNVVITDNIDAEDVPEEDQDEPVSEPVVESPPIEQQPNFVFSYQPILSSMVSLSG